MNPNLEYNRALVDRIELLERHLGRLGAILPGIKNENPSTRAMLREEFDRICTVLIANSTQTREFLIFANERKYTLPHIVCKFGEDQYLMWSTVVDAPITYMVNEETARDQFGSERVERANSRNGVSHLDYESLDELIAGNRAGNDETPLTKEQIIEKYTC